MRRRRRGESSMSLSETSQRTSLGNLEVPLPDQQDHAMKPDSPKVSPKEKQETNPTRSSPVQFETSFNSSFSPVSNDNSSSQTAFGTFPTTFSSNEFSPPPLSVNEVTQKTKELMVSVFTKLEKGQFLDALEDVNQSLKLFGK